jgi:eukaryotic-like serine/threonine-protein kinase
MARFAARDKLVFLRDDALFAQQFDLDRLELIGSPTLIAREVMRTPTGRVPVSVSRQGVLVYSAGQASFDQEAVWLDRSGKQVDSRSVSIPNIGRTFRLSPDGKRLAFVGTGGAMSTDLWIYDSERGIPTRLSTDPLAFDTAPVFSPDGSQVIFRRNKGDGPYSFQRQQVSGASPSESIFQAPLGEVVVPQGWTPDGQRLVYFSSGLLPRGIWSLPLVGDRVPIPYLVGSASRTAVDLSPDGRWLAYNSDEGGARQLFVQSFPDPTGDRLAVSKPGGGYARWRRDGREIFFVDGNGRLSAAPVRTQPTFGIGEATVLFEIPGSIGSVFQPYDVTPDGQRFIVIRPRGAPKPMKLTVSVNWMTSLGVQRTAAP